MFYNQTTCFSSSQIINQIVATNCTSLQHHQSNVIAFLDLTVEPHEISALIRAAVQKYPISIVLKIIEDCNSYEPQKVAFNAEHDRLKGKLISVQHEYKLKLNTNAAL